MLNTQWLHTFKTLVEVGHFTKTAEQLFMTQPGVSQHIKKLEAQLNTALLTKNGKQFELTEAGKEVYQYALQTQSDEERLREKIKIDSPFVGECSLAMSGSLCMQFQPLFLARQKEYRQLTILMEAAPNSKIIEGVLNNSIDLGVVTQQQPSPHLHYTLIGEEPLCLAVPKTLSSTDWTLEQLASLGVIDHPDCKHYLMQYLSASNRTNAIHTIPRTGYVNQLSQILYPVVQGLGFTVLPESAINAFSLKDQITVLSIANPVKEPLFLVHKQHRALPIRYQWFIDTLSAAFSHS